LDRIAGHLWKARGWVQRSLSHLTDKASSPPPILSPAKLNNTTPCNTIRAPKSQHQTPSQVINNRPPAKYYPLSIPHAQISVPLQYANGDKLLLNIIKLLPQNLIHSKHMHLILLENQLHLIIAEDLALVGWVLQVARFDVLPYLLDDLGA
jgi:hypothetical protein